MEHVGRAIRTPVRDAMTAHAAARLGGAWAFGVLEALDAGTIVWALGMGAIPLLLLTAGRMKKEEARKDPS